MDKPRVYADFHNADSRGRLRLNCVGTAEDLARQHVELREGMVLTLCSDDLDEQGRPEQLLVDGVVSFAEEEHCWVASIDWSAIRHGAATAAPGTNGDDSSSTAAPGQTGATRRST